MKFWAIKLLLMSSLVFCISYAAYAQESSEIVAPASDMSEVSGAVQVEAELQRNGIDEEIDEIEDSEPGQITETSVETIKAIGPTEEEKKERAKGDFEQLWESSVKNEYGEADITNDVDVQEIVEPSTEYRYASFGKRDPFVPPFGRFQIFSPNRGKSRFEIAVVNSLQRPLDDLQVIGVWQTESGDFNALIRVSDTSLEANERTPGRTESTTDTGSEAVVAKIGDPIGPSGKITAIADDRVETRQFFIEQDGTRKFEDVFLYLGIPEDVNNLSKKSIILGPGGQKIFKIESDVAGSDGGTRYIDAETRRDVTETFLEEQDNENRKRIGL
ncbi:pilus assembly protein PilP [Oligoflexaceae bacterium]|nr:pilus assembly protein PilP [Oligoflexaceae bacterium]